ncbi:nitroreductase [Eremomyces bilateralis CBS 781.70]|uniref:Nitroreductase n=1 Tax=Eremomyces bilateralis CBS 781.70 TaxID=1392243 RepID=A0A6G1GE42_9PEZI|nr:nitroreductase [Eremomyces bilateralis CBS 781.70]KAF1816367.1 nitroreductase [Eremomyces bilateralis CBS 781.70]
MGNSDTFLEAVKARRTIYGLNKKSPIPDSRIEEIVHHAVLHIPSSFNSQSTRLVVLLGKEHEKFWELVKEVVKPHVPTPEAWKGSEARLNGFQGGCGSILFFEDASVIHEFETKFAMYADKFTQWSEHTNAMHQYVLWTALEQEGLGCNLQHYNPIVDARAKQEWNIPTDWMMKAQLVFGGRAGEPGEKTFKPLEERVFIHGKSS